MSSIDVSYEFFYHKNFDLAVEIGTRFCESTLYLNHYANIKRLVTIDPYLQYDDYRYDGGYKTATDESYYKATQILSQYSNIELIRQTSKQAVDLFEDESIDFIFIDGNHSYQYVLDDLINYYPKVKNGGVLCGDDYFMNASVYGQKMVQEAVNKFANLTSLELKTRGKHGNISKGENECPKNWVFIKSKYIKHD